MAALTWRPATLQSIHDETASARTLRFTVEGWPGHLPGQHLDVRLTAADGYVAQRSYSLAAPGDDDRIALTVQDVPDGEVSGYLTRQIQPGDQIEVRGPLGGWFVWRSSWPEPVVLIAGGSGIVPLMAIARAHHAESSQVALTLIYSARTPDDLYFRDELLAWESGRGRVDVTIVYTRSAPEGWPRSPGRLATSDLPSPLAPPRPHPRCYICGPTGFVEATADKLRSLGYDPDSIRTERFGPTGG